MNIKIIKQISYIFLTAALAFTLSSCVTTPSTRTPSAPLKTDEVVICESAQTSIFAKRAGVCHSVAPGETLWRIAKMYEVDVDTIKNSNKIRNVHDIDIGTKLYIPNAAPRKNVITLYPNNKWQYIIIHHSATDFGSSEQFNKVHLSKGWEGVGYHFVIDNGTAGKDNGQIETTPRWLKQSNGAHCKAGGMNEKGIGVCLVGNFSDDSISEKQMQTLVYLVSKLKTFYKIPDSHIMGHGQVPGAQTECPGVKFPWKRFWSLLNKAS